LAAAAPTTAPAQTPVFVPRPLRYPLLCAAFAFAAGVGWARFTTSATHWTPPNWFIVAAAVLLLSCFALLHERVQLAPAAALLAIVLLAMAQFGLGPAHVFSALSPEFENQQVEIVGFVTRAMDPVVESGLRDGSRPAAGEKYQQIDLQTEKITCVEMDANGESACPVSTQALGIRVGIYKPIGNGGETLNAFASREQFSYGQRLRVRGGIRSPQVYENPGAFDRRAYLLNNGIAAVLGTKFTDVAVLPGKAGTRFGRWRARARQSLLQHVLALATPKAGGWRIFSISQTDAALLAAMLLGERSLLDQSVKLDFQRTGSYHLLVISGMAVAILAFAVFFIARLMRLSETWATLISVLFVTAYVTLTDLGAPVQRAALMCAVYMLARLLYRERNPLNAIGAAALFALVIEPKALFDAGFQMTFLAVLTIAGVAAPILERSTALYRKALHQLDSIGFDIHFPPKQAQFRIDLRMILARLRLFLPRWIAQLVFIGGLASASSSRRSHIYLGCDASSSGTANGNLFSPRDYARTAGKCRGGPHNGSAVARGHRDDAAQLPRNLGGIGPKMPYGSLAACSKRKCTHVCARQSGRFACSRSPKLYRGAVPIRNRCLPSCRQTPNRHRFCLACATGNQRLGGD
jgi:competence protein ComEC